MTDRADFSRECHNTKNLFIPGVKTVMQQKDPVALSYPSRCTLSFYGVVTTAQTRSECIMGRFTVAHTARLLYDVSGDFHCFPYLYAALLPRVTQAPGFYVHIRNSRLMLDTYVKYSTDSTKSLRSRRCESFVFEN